jgi:chromosome segregation ATPase
VLTAALAAGCGSPPGSTPQTPEDVPPPRVRRLRDQVNRLRAEAEVREMTLKSVRRRADLLADQVHQLQKENRRQLEQIQALGSAIQERNTLRKRLAALSEKLKTLRAQLHTLRQPDPNAE